MKHIDKMKRILEENLTQRPVLVYGDPDVDGLFAMYMVCKFLEKWGISYTHHLNKDRSHGFFIDPEEVRGQFIIAVDFDISREKMQELVSKDVSVLSLDHHSVESELIYEEGETGAKGLVLNNQYPFEEEANRYQSGAGVTYEAFIESYPELADEELESLVGITLLSDIRPIENERAKKYLTKTYNMSANKGYIGYLIEYTNTMTYGFGAPKMDRNFIDFTLSPRINALLRAGCEEEAVNFILGRGLEPDNTRAEQLQLLHRMEIKGAVLDLSDLKVVCVDTKDYKDDFPHLNITNYIGLYCSRLKGTGKSVLGFVMEEGKIIRASFRGRYDNVNYQQEFINQGIEAKGHHGAFGIPTFNPTENTWTDLNEGIGRLDKTYKRTHTVYEANNLGMFLNQKGNGIALENCYIRDMYRTYIKYTGSRAVETIKSYKTEPLTDWDYANGVKIVKTEDGVDLKYVRDINGEKVVKYIEYLVDGRIVKSFGEPIETGIILPMLEKGYVSLYVREKI